MAQFEWTYIPNFGDKNAKTNVTVNEKLNAKVVEVLYGAKDANGGSIPPVDLEDGHGRWVAIETNGKYQLISWKHSASEGGQVEAGKYDVEDGLADLEASLEQKNALIEKAAALKGVMEASEIKAKFDEIMNEWKTVHFYHTAKEDELFQKYQAVKSEVYDFARADIIAKKEAIVAKAQEVAASDDVVNGKAKLDALLEEWKTSGFAGKDKDQSLWELFSKAQNEFYAKRKAHFEVVNKEIAATKKDLIAKSKEVVANVTNYNEASAKMQELMDAWKKTGMGKKDTDDKLWAEFNGIRQSFFEAKKTFQSEQAAKLQKAVDEKNALIAKAKEVLANKDFSKENGEVMKGLLENWKKTGFAGKKNDQLWADFKGTLDAFWQEKKELAEAKHNQWVNNQKDAMNRKRKQIDQLWQEIKDTKAAAANARSKEEGARLMASISNHYDKIKELESQVGDIERKMK